MEAHKSLHVRSILNGADLWVPDGIAPVWMARRRGHRSAARAPGAEIMREFLRRANERGYRSFFYGDTEETLSALKDRVSSRYPGHRIVGCYSPPFRLQTPEEENAIIQQINAARPDVLWVALGMPKQDIWIHEHRHRIHVPVAIGVGAAFGFMAGTISRCPQWIGRAGFEWVYRLLKEPKKLWRRDLLDGPRFLFLATMELLRNENLIADHSGQPK
jgi:N-acetylglucosaminyldiphosphoundecaprenol N-acetyl-beta-D-mannosaminyltransferase